MALTAPQDQLGEFDAILMRFGVFHQLRYVVADGAVIPEIVFDVDDPYTKTQEVLFVVDFQFRRQSTKPAHIVHQ